MRKGRHEFRKHKQTRVINPPEIVYKYATVATNQAILQSSKLRFQSPLKYNDPLDSQWDVGWSVSTVEARAQYCTILERALLRPETWPANADPESKAAMDSERSRIMALPTTERRDEVSKFVHDCSERRGPDRSFVERMLDLRRRLRVLCVCECDRSILMWSHYADEHCGIVLGFDTAALEEHWQRPLEPIKYHIDLPCLIDSKAWAESLVYGLPTPAMLGKEREWVLTKHMDWQYEREWRFVWTADRGTAGLYQDYEFPANSLLQIVIGCRTEPTAAKPLIRLARGIQPNVRCFRLSTHPSRFELIKSEIDDA